MEREQGSEGMFSRLPIVVWAVVAPMIAMEVVIGLAGLGIVGGAEGGFWRIEAIQRFAFLPELARLMAETGAWTEGGAVRFLSYPFVHRGLIDAVFMVALTLALGKVAGEALGSTGFMAVFFGAAIAGGAAAAFVLTGVEALIGGFPAAYGLIGAFTFLLWARLGQLGGPRARAFGLIGMLVGLQIVFGLALGGLAGLAGLVPDLAGFAAGFVLAPFFVPGGMARIVAALRRRG
jgi:membrane associated rhomboid family serine protease